MITNAHAGPEPAHRSVRNHPSRNVPLPFGIAPFSIRAHARHAKVTQPRHRFVLTKDGGRVQRPSADDSVQLFSHRNLAVIVRAALHLLELLGR